MFPLNEGVRSDPLQIAFGQHCTTIEIVAAPFELPHFPGQKFPSLHCNYTVCCQRADLTVARERVCEAARNYLLRNFYYSWDFSHSCNLTSSPLPELCHLSQGQPEPESFYERHFRDSSQPEPHSTQSSLTIGTQSKRQQSQLSNPGAKPHTDDDAHPSSKPRKCKRLNDESWFIYQRTRNGKCNWNAVVKETNERFRKNHSLSVLQRRARRIKERAAGVPETQLRPDVSHDNKTQINIFVEKVHQGIREIFVNMNPVTMLEDGPRKMTAREYGDSLFIQAHELKKGIKKPVWFIRFIAACAHLVDSANPNDCSSPLDSNLLDLPTGQPYRWRVMAQMVNSIVNALLPTRRWKATLIYSALAVTNFSLSVVADWDSSRRNEVVDGVVEFLLRDKALDDLGAFDDFIVFDPVLLISQDLNMGYSDIATTLGLPKLEPNTNAHTRVDIFRNPHTTTLFRRIGTNITNNNDASSSDSTSTKEGYTTSPVSGSASDPNPHSSECHSSVARSTDLAGQAKENEHMHLSQQIQQENMLGAEQMSPPSAATAHNQLADCEQAAEDLGHDRNPSRHPNRNTSNNGQSPKSPCPTPPSRENSTQFQATPPHNSAEPQASRKGICSVGQFLDFGINELSDMGLPSSTLGDEPPLADVDGGYYPNAHSTPVMTPVDLDSLPFPLNSPVDFDTLPWPNTQNILSANTGSIPHSPRSPFTWYDDTEHPAGV